MRYLLIVFRDFRMCFFDNGLPSHASTAQFQLQPFDINIEHLLHSPRSIDEIKHVLQCRKSTPRRPRHGRAGAQCARPRYLRGNVPRGNDFRVIVTQPLRKLITLPQAL